MKIIRKLNIFLLIAVIICTAVFTGINLYEEKYGDYQSKTEITIKNIDTVQEKLDFKIENNGKADIGYISFYIKITNAQNPNQNKILRYTYGRTYIYSENSVNLYGNFNINYEDSWMIGMDKNELIFSYRVESITFKASDFILKTENTYTNEDTTFIVASVE